MGPTVYPFQARAISATSRANTQLIGDPKDCDCGAVSRSDVKRTTRRESAVDCIDRLPRRAAQEDRIGGDAFDHANDGIDDEMLLGVDRGIAINPAHTAAAMPTARFIR